MTRLHRRYTYMVRTAGPSIFFHELPQLPSLSFVPKSWSSTTFRLHALPAKVPWNRNLTLVKLGVEVWIKYIRLRKLLRLLNSGNKGHFLKELLDKAIWQQKCTLLSYQTAGKSRAEVYKCLVPYGFVKCNSLKKCS